MKALKPKRRRRLNSDPLASLKIWRSPASVRTVANIQNLAFNQVQKHCYKLIKDGKLRKHCRGYCFTSDRMGVNIYIATEKGKQNNE